MGYQRQTQEIGFRGRNVFDASDKLFKEIRAQEAENRRVNSERNKQQIDYEKALDVWDKNQASLYKEKVEFWDKVSPTLSKLAEDTLTKAYEWKVQRDVDEERRKFNELSAEEQYQYKQQATALLTRSNITDIQNLGLEALARKEGHIPLADYLRGLNGLGLKLFTVKLANERMRGFQHDIDNFIANNPEATLEDVSVYALKQRQAVEETLSATGMNSRVLTSLIDEPFNRINDTIANTFHTHELQRTYQNNLDQTISTIGLELNLLNIDNLGNDNQTLEFIKLYSESLRAGDNFSRELNGPAGVTDIGERHLKVFAEWVASFSDEDDRNKAADFVKGLLTGRFDLYNNPTLANYQYQTTGGLRTLDDFFGESFTVDNFESSVRTEVEKLTGTEAGAYAAKIEEQTRNLNANNIWLEGQEGEEPPDSQRILWRNEYVNANPERRLEMLEELETLATSIPGLDQSLVRKILSWDDGLLAITDQNELSAILNRKADSGQYGVNSISIDDSILENNNIEILTDDNTGQRYIKTNENGVERRINVVTEGFATSSESQNSIQAHESNFIAAIGGVNKHTISSQLVLENLTNKLEVQVNARRTAWINEGNSPDSFNEAEAINEESAKILAQFQDDMANTESEYYYNKDVVLGGEIGGFPNLTVTPHGRDQRTTRELFTGIEWADERQIVNQARYARTLEIAEVMAYNAARDGNGAVQLDTLILDDNQLSELNGTLYTSRAVTRPGNQHGYVTTYTGELPQELVRTSLALGWNPYDFANNQRRLKYIQENGSAEGFVPVEMPENASVLWESFGSTNQERISNYRDLFNSITGSGYTFSAKQPNVVAQRQIVQLTESLYDSQNEDSNTPTLHNTHISNALTDLSGGAYDYRGDGYYGKYGFREEDIITYYEERGITPQGSYIDDFLSNRTRQDDAVSWAIGHYEPQYRDVGVEITRRKSRATSRLYNTTLRTVTLMNALRFGIDAQLSPTQLIQSNQTLLNYRSSLNGGN